jgi:tetratricopeptide (TPR) repeat protein
MNSMKRLKTAGLLCAALFLFVMSGTAQTKDDVINAFNKGAQASKVNDFATAVASFQQVIDLGTKVGAESDTLRKNAEKYIAGLQWKLAASVYQNAASSNADKIAAFQKAKDLADKYGDAAVSTQVTNLMPKIYTGMAQAAFKANDFPGALAYFDKVIELDPGNIQAYYNKAIVYKKQNVFDPMVQALNKSIELASKTNDTISIKKSKLFLASEYMTLATASYLKGDTKGTLVPLTESLKYDDKNAQAYYIMADTKNKLKDYDGALEAVTKGLQYENPTAKELVARFYLQQGVAYAAKNEKEKAVESFKQASVGKYIPTAQAYIKGLTAKPAAAPVKK